MIKKIIITTAVFFTLLVPSVSLVYAQSSPAPVAGGQTSQVVTIQNPLKYTSIDAIVKALIDVIEYIGAIACALWIIWAGFLYVKAQGKPEALTDANKTLLHAIIGTAIILGAGAILTIIQSTITSIKS